MKRAKNLFPKIVAFSNLVKAFHQAQKGKRYRREVARFRLDLEKELVAMQEALLDGSYALGDYRTFHIRDPKPRLISAAPFRDRILHHAICNVIGPVLERGMIFDTYANRKEKGTNKAILRYQHFARRYDYALKADIQKFFPSIDHAVLKDRLARKIGCPPTLAWIYRIIDHSNPQEPVLSYFPGDDLFTVADRRRGLPIGNLCSQLFANYYLDGLDHFVKETLRCPAYVRYVDDFVLLDDSSARLQAWQAEIGYFLQAYRLNLHGQKTQVLPVAAGHSFLGHRVFPAYRTLRSQNVRRFRRRNRQQLWRLRNGHLTLPEYHQSLTSWAAHASFSHTETLQNRIFADIEQQGVCVFPARVVSGRLQARQRTDAARREPQPQQPPQPQ